MNFESDDRLVGRACGDVSVDGGRHVLRQRAVVSGQIVIWIEKITQIDLRKISGINGLPTSIWSRNPAKILETKDLLAKYSI